MEKNISKTNDDDLENALILWLNSSFQLFENEKIENIIILRDPIITFGLLNEIDKNYFDISKIPESFDKKDDSSQLYSWSHLLSEIKSFYNDELEINLNNEEFNAIKVRELIQDNPNSSSLIYITEQKIFIEYSVHPLKALGSEGLIGLIE